MERIAETTAINGTSIVEESLKSASDALEVLASTDIKYVLARVRAEVEPAGEIKSNVAVAMNLRQNTLVMLTVLHERAGALTAEVSVVEGIIQQNEAALTYLSEYITKFNPLTEPLNTQFNALKEQHEEQLAQAQLRKTKATELSSVITSDEMRARQSLIEIDQYIEELKKLAAERASKLSEFVLLLSDINRLGDVPPVPGQFEPEGEVQLVMSDLNEWLGVLEPNISATTSVTVPAALMEMPAPPVELPHIGVQNMQEEQDVSTVEPVRYSRFAPVVPRSGRVIINQEEVK